jgi:predicted ATP-binding protein involved in virulence
MKIQKIKLSDFRCFDDLQITFSDKYNTHVIIAENMVGKSAILAALRIAANTYISGLISGEKQIQLSDHRILGDNPISDISPSVEINIQAIIKDSLQQNIVSEWKKYKTKPKGENTKVEILSGIDPRKESRLINKMVAEGKSIQPLFSFIGTEYIHVVSSDTVDWQVDGKSIDGYKGCFADKSIEKYLFKWLAKIDTIIQDMQRKPLLADIYKNIPKDAMNVFQQAVTSILPDIKIIEWNTDLKQPFVKLKNGQIRPFNVLSDGYRYLILLAGELATRAFILNKFLGVNVLNKIHGLVLIDEFGIHLHPALQNDALIRLQNTFPNVQFIVSTHSPLLLNGLKKEQVHIISFDENGKRFCVNPDEDIIGMGANEILTKIFGLPTTMDKEFIEMNELFTSLFVKKKNNLLNEDESKQFAEISKKMSEFRLDPQLQLVSDDPITALVRERINQKTEPDHTLNFVENQKTIEEKVDDILKNIFSSNK